MVLVGSITFVGFHSFKNSFASKDLTSTEVDSVRAAIDAVRGEVLSQIILFYDSTINTISARYSVLSVWSEILSVK